MPDRNDDPELAAVVAEHRLQTVFQPQFDLSSGKLVGAEALARMPGDDDAEGLFERAAAAGLAERVSREMQREALRLTAGFGSELDGLGISINILPQDIARASYPDWLAGEIERARVDFGRITIELTEEAVVGDIAAVAARLDRLRALGLKVALDDFGTGFASFAHLARLPIDILKIDRGLIAGIERGHRERVVVRSVLRLARDLDLTVVVEGVETAVQLEMLREWGCDHYQGFIRARPMPLAQFKQFAALHA
ncbi:MAG: EAL domain-containing protein [Sphingomicrobium sp.]